MKKFFFPLIALTLGIVLGLSITFFTGENPLHVAAVLANGAFGSFTNIGYSLYYSVPLIFAGLSVSWALRSGLFNIGAEGQMALGGVAMAIVGISFPSLPLALAIPLALLAGFLAGAFWGMIAGYLKAYRGCHEVLGTILLNFVAYGIVSYLIVNVYRNKFSQAPETIEIGSGYHLLQLTESSPLNFSLFISFITIAVAAFTLKKTKFGFIQRLSGDAPLVSARAGVNIKFQTVLALFISGGIAGLAGMSEILGYSFKAREGFTANAGFVGIAVALLGGESFIGIVLAAILFGALHKGSLDLDIDTKSVSRDLAQVIQALAILFVASHRRFTSGGKK